jgi:signal transduction histidine kinase
MNTYQPIHLRNARLLNLAVYLSLVMLIGVGFVQIVDPLRRLLVILFCLAFGLIHHLGFPAIKEQWQARLFIGGQMVVVTALGLVTGSSDPFNFPFYFLSIQATLLFPLRTAIGWIVAFFLIGCLNVIGQTGRIGPIYLLFYPAVYTFVGLYGYTLRQVEVARQENERLLAELRSTQAQLHELAVSEERNRLARDLHDSAKQQAFALSAQLDAVRSLFARDPAAAEQRLQQAEQLADQLRQELAAMIADLRPPALGQQGLATALRQYAEEWGRQHGIATTVQSAAKQTLPLTIEGPLYRIAQEALANVARHSQAQQVEISLSYTSCQMTLTIRDNGCGFDPTQSTLGVGLQSMRERASTLPDGRLTLTSAPGQGTSIVVECRP